MKQVSHAPRGAHRIGTFLAGATLTAAMLLLPGATGAQAARVATASVCSAIASSSVSAIVGYTVPAPTVMTDDIAASKKNLGISAVDTSCAYGAEKSLADLKKLVLLESSTESKALTSSQLATLLEQQQKTIGSTGLKISSYSGLGVPAFFYSADLSGVYFEGISALDGKHGSGAAVYSKSVSESKLAALAKLAEKL